MNITSSNIKSNYIIDEPKHRSKNRLTKSSSTTSNNYSLYEKYIHKISLYKTKSRNTENNLRKNNSSSSKFLSKLGNNQSSFNLSNFEGESKLNNNNFSAFSRIMEYYFQQKSKEMLKRKQNVPLRKNDHKNKKIVVEINSNNSTYNKKNNFGNNIINQHSKQSTKRKTENKNNNINRFKTTRNRNLSMKDIENISYLSSSKILNNTNSNKIKKKENIIVKKIFQSDSNQIKINKKKTPLSPSYCSNTNRNLNSNKKICQIKKNDSNLSEISALEKKYNILFNTNDNNNKIYISKNTNSKVNYTSLSEVTKPNTLNAKIEIKEDELEGPENIHFSLVDLIQKGRKKMEEIV
jgi:hypothetical protein